jgi:hypothetical protein
MTRRQRDEVVEARADLILAVEFTAAAYAGYFEFQLRSGKIRQLLRLLGKPCRTVLTTLGSVLGSPATWPCAI